MVVVPRIEPGKWTAYALDIRYDDGAPRLVNPRLFASSFAFLEPKDYSQDSCHVIFASTQGRGRGDKSLQADAFSYDSGGQQVMRYTTSRYWEEPADALTGDGGPDDAVVFISDRDTPNPLRDVVPLPIKNNWDWATVAVTAIPLLVWTSHELYVAGSAGDRGPVRRLTYDYPKTGWVVREPRWSPDARSVSFLQQAKHGSAGWNFSKPGAWRTMLLTFDCGQGTQQPVG